jgi:RpiB/LacA/LacB family sugar-phosphate isomerase
MSSKGSMPPAVKRLQLLSERIADHKRRKNPYYLKGGTCVRIVVAGDHAGFDLKLFLATELRQAGHDVLDLGAFDSIHPDDYPDFAMALGRAVLDGRGERGILVCGSGVGVSVAANKIHGIRAGLCHDTYSAHQGVEHDNMNVLVLGSRVVGFELARDLVAAFLGASFTNEERHVRRLAKVDEIERRGD